MSEKGESVKNKLTITILAASLPATIHQVADEMEPTQYTGEPLQAIKAMKK